MHPLTLIWKKYSLLVWLALILIVGFLATSLASYWVSRDQIRHTIVDQGLPLTGDNIYSEIQKDVLRPTFISSLMANDTFVRDWILSGENDTHQIVRYLNEMKQKYSTMSSFLVSEKTHRYYYADGVLKNVSAGEARDEWYFRVRDMPGLYEMNLDQDLANNDTITIFINYKVMDFNGNFIGATGVGLTLDTLARVIEDVQNRFNRRIYFINPKGDIIVSGKTGAMQKSSIHSLPGIQDIAGDIINNRTQPTQLSYRADDRHVLLSSRFIPELNWYLIVEQADEPEVLLVRRVLFGNFAVSAAVTLLVLLLCLYSVNRFQRRLENIAATDSLTGLLNRQAFELIFIQAQHEISRTKKSMSVILLDIDHFKSTNDTYGHLNGDKVIQKTTELLSQHLRNGDILCRWGGEEFLVLLKETPLAGAQWVAEKLRLAIAQQPIDIDDKALHITSSFGVGEYANNETLDQLFARIDDALYRAKALGRNRVEVTR